MALILKVMHDGADEFLANESVPSDVTFSIFADVTECHFKRNDPGNSQYAGAHLRIRELVKTANVEGFVEVEKHIDLTGDAFLMNEQGRTISKFRLRPFGHEAAGSGAPQPDIIGGGTTGVIRDSALDTTMRARGGGKMADDEFRTGDEEAEAVRALCSMPWKLAAQIRRAAAMSVHFKGCGAPLLALMDRERIAVDA